MLINVNYFFYNLFLFYWRFWLGSWISDSVFSLANEGWLQLKWSKEGCSDKMLKYFTQHKSQGPGRIYVKT